MWYIEGIRKSGTGLQRSERGGNQEYNYSDLKATSLLDN
jgi:hypothetical protein